MSALPTPPPDRQEPLREPHPRRRWTAVAAWIAGGMVALILLVAIAAIVFVRSSRGHQFLLAKTEQKASQALGSQVQARTFTVAWSGVSPTVTLYDVAVSGAPPYVNPPLLRVDRMVLGITVTSLLHRNWYIDEVQLDHPVVRVFVDARGTDNLPQTKSSGQSNTSVFDLGVRHARLTRGEIYYNNRKSALEADLHNLEIRSTFDTARRAYSGTLSYRDGHLRYGNYRPIPHSLDAVWTASPQAFTLERATLSSGHSHLALNATLTDYAHPRMRASYDALLDTAQFRAILRNPSLPGGMIRARGDLAYASRANVPMLQGVTLQGTLSSPALSVATASFRGDIRDIAARYSIAGGNASLRDLRARLLGGELTGSLTMRDFTGNPRSHLQAALHGVSMAQLKPLIRSATLSRVALRGGANATVDATWGTTMSDLVARADATLNGHLTPAAGGSEVPLTATVHARYSAPAKTLSLAQTYLRLPQTSLNLNGTVSTRSALQVTLRSADLRELESIAAMFRSPGQAAQPLGLGGSATFTGQVTGSTLAPHVAGLLNAANLTAKGSSWRFLRANVDLSPSRAAIQNGSAQAMPRGSIRFDLSAGLDHWSFTRNSPFQLRVRASQLDIAKLQGLAGSSAPVSGTLAANVSASGTELNPQGSGTLRISNAVLSGQPVHSVNVDFRGNGSQVNAILQAKLPAGAAHGTLSYFPRQESFQAQVRALGIKLQQLQVVKDRNLDVRGVLNLTASGSGNIRNPMLQASLRIPQLQMSGQTIRRLNLEATVANRVANFQLASDIVNTSVSARGTVNLTGDYVANATLDTQAIPLGPLVAAYAPSQAGNITGQTELHATLQGPLKKPKLVNAHAVVPALTLNYKNAVQLAAAGPIRADYTAGVLQVQHSAIRGTDTNLQFQGSIPIADRSRPMSLLLLGSVDLKLAQLLQPSLTSSGQLQFNINSYGQSSNPDVQGEVRIVNASVATGTLPLGLQNANGVLTLTKDRLNITQFHGTVGGGDLSASGGVVYRPALRLDLALSAKGIRLLYENSIRAGFDANLALAGTTKRSLLRGSVTVDQLQFTPDFDLMNFMSKLGGGAATPPPAQGMADNVKLDVAVTSGGGVHLVSKTMSLNAAANLHVNGTAAQPVILGRMNFNGGDLILMGNRYVIQNGTVDFVNASETQPVVNLAVGTTIDQYDIRMHFWGPADHLRVNYASDPALPPSDIINLVAFGKTSEASAMNPAPPGPLGAESLVASQVSGQVTNKLEKIVGISQLTIDPVLAGGQQTPGARIAIKQRVSSKIFVTFATDVTATQRNMVSFEYQISPRKSINVARDQNGGFSVDTRFRKRW